MPIFIHLKKSKRVEEESTHFVIVFRVSACVNFKKNTDMLKRFKNWKTTLIAIIVAVSSGLSWEHGQELGQLVIDAVAFITLLLAKD